MSRATQDTTNNKFNCRIRSFHALRPTFPSSSSNRIYHTAWSYNPNNAETLLVWANPRSLATTKGITFVFFSYGYLDVSVPHVRSPLCGVVHLQCTGLPHSEICGSNRMCRSPQLIAAYHVLLRLREPRHPPSALIYFAPYAHN